MRSENATHPDIMSAGSQAQPSIETGWELVDSQVHSPSEASQTSHEDSFLASPFAPTTNDFERGSSIASYSSNEAPHASTVPPSWHGQSLRMNTGFQAVNAGRFNHDGRQASQPHAMNAGALHFTSPVHYPAVATSSVPHAASFDQHTQGVNMGFQGNRAYPLSQGNLGPGPQFSSLSTFLVSISLS
jgi:hypothetical protein